MDDIAFKEIGRYVRQKRIKAGLSQVALSRRLSCTSQFVANWGRGASAPPKRSLKKLSKALGLRESEVLSKFLRVKNGYLKRLILGKK